MNGPVRDYSASDARTTQQGTHEPPRESEYTSLRPAKTGLSCCFSGNFVG
jgi:hypothetical protein